MFIFFASTVIYVLAMIFLGPKLEEYGIKKFSKTIVLTLVTIVLSYSLEFVTDIVIGKEVIGKDKAVSTVNGKNIVKQKESELDSAMKAIKENQDMAIKKDEQ